MTFDPLSQTIQRDVIQFIVSPSVILLNCSETEKELLWWCCHLVENIRNYNMHNNRTLML